MVWVHDPTTGSHHVDRTFFNKDASRLRAALAAFVAAAALTAFTACAPAAPWPRSRPTQPDGHHSGHHRADRLTETDRGRRPTDQSRPRTDRGPTDDRPTTRPTDDRPTAIRRWIPAVSVPRRRISSARGTADTATNRATGGASTPTAATRWPTTILGTWEEGWMDVQADSPDLLPGLWRDDHDGLVHGLVCWIHELVPAGRRLFLRPGVAALQSQVDAPDKGARPFGRALCRARKAIAAPSRGPPHRRRTGTRSGHPVPATTTS